MSVGEANEIVSDVKVTWGAVLNNGPLAKHRWLQKKEFPTYAVLMENANAPINVEHDVLIRRDNPEELREMRDWLEEHARKAYKMFGRFNWTDHGLSVERKLEGLLFRFEDANAAFFFKMRWYFAPGVA
jgi:hypothetical protein